MNKKQMSKNQKINILIAVFSLLLFFLVLLPVKNKIQIFTVASGSMEPALKTGSLIFIKPANEYKTGDVITFTSSSNINQTITHRIISSENKDGQTYFTTKGDANNSQDLDQVHQDRILGKYIFKIPYIGYVISFVRTLPGLIFVIIIPSVIIVYEELKGIRKILAKKLKKQPK